MSDEDDERGRPRRAGARRPDTKKASKGKPRGKSTPEPVARRAEPAKAQRTGPSKGMARPKAAKPARPASARAAKPTLPKAGTPTRGAASARAAARPAPARPLPAPSVSGPPAPVVAPQGASPEARQGAARPAARPPRPRITGDTPPVPSSPAAPPSAQPVARPARASVRRPSLPPPALLAAPTLPNADTRAPRSAPQPAPAVRLEPSSPGTVSAPSDAKGRSRPAARASIRPASPAGSELEPRPPELAPMQVDELPAQRDLDTPPELEVFDDTSQPIAPPDEPAPPPPAIEVAVFDDASQPPPAPPSVRESSPSSPPPAIAVPDDSLYEVEETIDRFLGDVASTDDREARRRAAEAFAQVAAHLGGTAETEGGEGLARELLRPGYYVRQWGRLGLRNRSEEVDELGLDRAYEARFLPLFESVYRRWFRVAARGLEHVPSEGRCLVVANHGGALPWDGLMLRTAMRLEHPSQRELRWLAEDFVSHAPFLGAFTNRVGAVRACPENAERMLSRDMLVAVFPEGEKGVAKPFRARYELQRFGRGGYVKLALRMRAPIVPTAIVGSEEAHPLLFRSRAAARLVGLPFLPVTPTFPWLGPLGLVPLPSRWVILCGEPIHLEDADPDDPIAVTHLNDRVRGAVNDLVRRALEMRASPYL